MTDMAELYIQGMAMVIAGSIVIGVPIMGTAWVLKQLSCNLRGTCEEENRRARYHGRK